MRKSHGENPYIAPRSSRAMECVVVKMAPRTQNCFSRVRRSAGLSIPGRDTDYMSCSVFICTLCSLYSALNVIPLQNGQPWCTVHCRCWVSEEACGQGATRIIVNIRKWFGQERQGLGQGQGKVQFRYEHTYEYELVLWVNSYTNRKVLTLRLVSLTRCHK